MKRFILFVLLTVFMFFCVVSPVMASQINNTDLGENTVEQELHNQKVMKEKEKILDLLTKLGEARTQSELDNSKIDILLYDKAKRESYEENLEKQLFDLGVTELTDNELKTMQAMDVTPAVTPPKSTSSVKWYSYRVGVYSGGQHYEVQELYAQGLNSKTNLANGRNGVTLYSKQQIRVSSLKQIGSIYAQKAVGTVPVVQWLPYELLFSNNNGVTNNSHVVTYRSLSTVCFSYVKRKGQSDSNQKLSYISNMVSIASTNTLAGYRNGKPYTKSTDKTNTSYATNYASSTAAVNAYKNNVKRNSFIRNYKFYNHNKTKSITQSVLTPSYPVHVK